MSDRIHVPKHKFALTKDGGLGRAQVSDLRCQGEVKGEGVIGLLAHATDAHRDCLRAHTPLTNASEMIHLSH